MRRYFTFGPTAKYGHDQRMLGLMLWPLIRNRCLVHDKYYRLSGVHRAAARPQEPYRRRVSEYRCGAGRGRALGNPAAAVAMGRQAPARFSANQPTHRIQGWLSMHDKIAGMELSDGHIVKQNCVGSVKRDQGVRSSCRTCRHMARESIFEGHGLPGC